MTETKLEYVAGGAPHTRAIPQTYSLRMAHIGMVAEIAQRNNCTISAAAQMLIEAGFKAMNERGPETGG